MQNKYVKARHGHWCLLLFSGLFYQGLWLASQLVESASLCPQSLYLHLDFRHIPLCSAFCTSAGGLNSCLCDQLYRLSRFPRHSFYCMYIVNNHDSSRVPHPITLPSGEAPGLQGQAAQAPLGALLQTSKDVTVVSDTETNQSRGSAADLTHLF